MKNTYKKFGEFIKNKRVAAGLSQTEASQYLSYTPQFICNWEKGKSMPPLDKLHQISKLYRIDPEELISILLYIQEEVFRDHLKTKNKTARKCNFK